MKKVLCIASALAFCCFPLHMSTAQSDSILRNDATLQSLASTRVSGDESDISATLKVKPEFVCEKPLFVAMTLGDESNHVIWFALDKSDADADIYDTLYVDVNANGDLSEEAEKFLMKNKSSRSSRNVFALPDLKISDDGPTHTEFKFTLKNAESGVGMINLKWNDQLPLGGGYPIEADRYMHFAGSVAQAPVIRFKGDAPFEFQRWIAPPLTIGTSNDFKVFLGWEGKGHSSFCTTLGHILPEEEVVLAALEYTDVHGVSQLAHFEFGERC